MRLYDSELYTEKIGPLDKRAIRQFAKMKGDQPIDACICSGTCKRCGIAIRPEAECDHFCEDCGLHI